MTIGSGLTMDANAGGAADTSGERSTNKYNTGNNTTDRNNINDSAINRLTGNSNGQYLRINPMVDTSNKAFEGPEPDIGCVLGLRFKKCTRK